MILDSSSLGYENGMNVVVLNNGAHKHEIKILQPLFLRNDNWILWAAEEKRYVRGEDIFQDYCSEITKERKQQKVITMIAAISCELQVLMFLSELIDISFIFPMLNE